MSRSLRAAVLLPCFASTVARISPGLHPGSDDKFFGKDYPDDGRPFDVSKQGFKPPYPSIQESDQFDKDYVKDENKDNGEWQAQMEYDMARAKVRRAKEALRKAEGMTVGEKAAYDAAYQKAIASGATAAEAHKKAEAARRRHEDAKAAEGAAEGEAAGLKDKAGHLSPGTVDDGDLKAAQENLQKEEFQFKICQEQLEKAKQALSAAQADAVAKEKEEEANAANQQKSLNAEADADAAEVARLRGEEDKASADEQAALHEENDLTAAQAAAEKLAAEAMKKVKLSHMSVAELQDHLDKIEEALRVAEYILKYFRQHGGPPAFIPDHIRHPVGASSIKSGAAGGSSSDSSAEGGGGAGALRKNRANGITSPMLVFSFAIIMIALA